MQRSISALLVIVLSGLLIMSLGCGKKPVEPIKNKVVKQKNITQKPEEAINKIPGWFLDPPKDPNYLYSTATSQSRDLGLALMDAENVGSADITGQIQTKVTAMFQRFREEAGVGEDAELTSLSKSISQEVVSEVVSGIRTAKKEIVPEGSMSYRGYVLMEMPIGLANATLVKKVKANNSMYTRFRASEAFKELEEEVSKYKQEK